MSYCVICKVHLSCNLVQVFNCLAPCTISLNNDGPCSLQVDPFFLKCFTECTTQLLWFFSLTDRHLRGLVDGVFAQTRGSFIREHSRELWWLLVFPAHWRLELPQTPQNGCTLRWAGCWIYTSEAPAFIHCAFKRLSTEKYLPSSA